MGRNNGGEEFANKIKSLYLNDDEKETGVEEWIAKYRKSKIDSFKNNEEIFEKKSVKKTENRGKQQIRRPHVKEKKKILKGKIVAWLLSGAMMIGGVAIGTSACRKINIGNKPIDTKQAVHVLGETPQSLGITNEQYYEIQSIKNLLEDGSLSDEKIIQMAPRIKNLCIDITTGKLANALGVSDNSIHLEHRYAEEGRTEQTVIVDSNHVTTRYRSKDFLTFNNSISDEIATSIKNIDRMNKIMERIQDGDYQIDSVRNEYRDIVNSLDEFAASKIRIENNDNIYIEATRNKDILDVLNAKGYIQETDSQIEEKLHTLDDPVNEKSRNNNNPINPNINNIQEKIRNKYYPNENVSGEDYDNGENEYENGDYER